MEITNIHKSYRTNKKNVTHSLMIPDHSFVSLARFKNDIIFNNYRWQPLPLSSKIRD